MYVERPSCCRRDGVEDLGIWAGGCSMWGARIVVYLVLAYWMFLAVASLGAWDRYDCGIGGVSNCTPPVHPHAYVLAPIAIAIAMLAVIVGAELWVARTKGVRSSGNEVPRPPAALTSHRRAQPPDRSAPRAEHRPCRAPGTIRRLSPPCRCPTDP